MEKMWNLLQACHARTILEMERRNANVHRNHNKAGKEASFRWRSLPIIVPISLW
jgi:hypothetical protein